MSKITWKKDKRQQLLQKAVQLCLASGMLVMPWTGWTSEIVRTDGGAHISAQGSQGAQTFNVYAGKDLGNKVGASTFSKFDVTSGDIANMHFRTGTSTNQFNTLLNFVDSKININGTVNAIRNSKIDGHLYFLSPNGMAVGAGGAINAGALTVITPTTDWWSYGQGDGTNFNLANVDSGMVESVQNLAVPINADGTIAIQGKVNVANDIRMKAGKINIGMDENDANRTAAVLRNDVTDFTNVVNMTDAQKQLAGLGSDLTAVQVGVDGDIILAAEVSTNENDCAKGGLINNQVAEATVNVVGGSKITARQDVDITATVVNNVGINEYATTDSTGAETFTYMVNGQELTADEFNAQYVQSEGTGEEAILSIFGATTSLKATVNIEDANTKITGERVNIQALAKNVYENSSNYSYLLPNGTIGWMTWDDVDADMWFSFLFNGLDVVYGDMNNYAEVNIGKGTTIKATGADKIVEDLDKGTSTTVAALNIGAEATMELSLGTKALSINVNHNQTIPGIGFIWGQVDNRATVNIAGTLISEHGDDTNKIYGSTAIKALATATINEDADTGYGLDGRSLTSDAGLNFGVVVLQGENAANIKITKDADLTDLAGNVQMSALANNSLGVNNILKTSDLAATAFGVSWEDYVSVANIDIDAPVVSKKGNIVTLADSEMLKNDFVVQAEAGDAGFFSSFTKNYRIDKDTVANDMTNKLQQLFSFGGSGSSNITNLISSMSSLGFADGIFQSLNQKLKCGVSFGYLGQDNTAQVNIGANGSLNAAGALTVQAKANYNDLKAQVYGASSNQQDGTAGKDFMGNGAILLSDVKNDANVLVANGDRTALQAKGTITLQADSLMPYNRINNMIAKIEYCCDVVAHSFDNLSEDDYDADDWEVMQEAYTDLQNRVAQLKSQICNEDGTLKEEYADSSDGYSQLLEEINAFTEDGSVEKFATLMQGKTYTYTDADGVEHEVKFKDTSSTGLLETITTAVDDLLVAIQGSLGVVGAALDFAEPANYVNYYVGSATKGNKQYASAPKYALAIDFGMNSTANNSRIMVGDSALINSTGGGVSLKANTEANDAALYGKVGTTGGGKKFSGALAVGAANLANSSLITVADNAKISALSDIGIKADNFTNHVIIGEALNLSSGNEAVAITAVVLFISGSSDSIVSIDDEADLSTSGNITIDSDNTTDAVIVSGGLAYGNKAANSDAVGMLTLSRNNYATIGDNDAENLSDEEIIDRDVFATEDPANKDSEEQRLKKLVAQHSGMDSATRANYFGSTSKTNKGEISALSLSSKALSDGDIVNVAMDLGYGSDSATDNAVKIGSGISGSLGNSLNSVNTSSNTWNGICNNLGNAINSMVPTSNNGAGTLPTTSFSGTGSVALTDLNAHTLAMIDGTNITLTKGDTAKLDVLARDSGLIVAVSGGVSYSKKKAGSGNSSSGKNSVTLAGAAAVNLISNETLSQISNSTIEQAKSITNKAEREGCLVAAAADVNIAYNSGGSTSGTEVTVGGSTSVNVANYGTRAVMKDNDVNVNFKNEQDNYTTALTNQATNKDAQGGGCLDLELAIGGKTGVTIGGVVTYDEVNNAVEANMTGGGNYWNMGAVNNLAITDLTQIQATVGFGISPTASRGTEIEGSASVGEFHNYVHSAVEGITLEGDSFLSGAYDAKLDENTHIQVLNSQGFDLSGDAYLTAAADMASNEDEKLQDEGNLLVNAALQISASGGTGTNVAVGASVAVVEMDNDYGTSVNNSTIKAKTVGTKAENNTLEVGVAAGGNGTSNGFAGSGSVVVTIADGEMVNEVKNSNIYADTFTMNTLNASELVNVAGAITVGAKCAAAGADVVYNYLGTATKAALMDTNVYGFSTTGAEVDIEAANEADFYAVAAEVDVSGKYTALAGSVAINQGRNDVSAVAESDNNNTMSLSNFTLKSTDSSYYASGAGGLEILYGKKAYAAIGGAVAWNELGVEVDENGAIVEEGKTQYNQALVRGYDITSLTGDMLVQALDEAEMVTVGVAASVVVKTGESKGSAALEGADATTRMHKQTSAEVYDTNINKDQEAQGNLNIEAETSNETESIAVVVAVDAGYVALGAGTAQTTQVGDTITALAGGIYNLDDVLVKADSYQKLLSNVVGVAASELCAVGGSVNVNDLDNDTQSILGYSDGSNVTTVNADGNVGVVALSHEDFENYVGQANIIIDTKKAAVGAGAAVAVNEVGGDTIAQAQNAKITTKAATGKTITLRDSINGTTGNYTGLVVGADGYHKFYNAPWSGGLTISAKSAAICLDATVGVDSMSGSTKALVNSVNLNENKTEDIEDNNDFTVLATDFMDANTVITTADVGVSVSSGVAVSVTVGAGVNTEENNRTVEAQVTGDAKRKKVNADKVKVKADSKSKMKTKNTAVSVSVAVTSKNPIPSTSGSSGGSSSGDSTSYTVSVGAAVAVGVSYYDLDNVTRAGMTNVESYNNGLTINANHVDDFELTSTTVTVPVSFSTIGVAPAVGVQVITVEDDTTTEAFLEDSQVYHYEDGTAEDSITAKGVIKITDSDVNVDVAIGTVSFGVGVLVPDNEFNQVVGTTIEDSTIGTASKQAKNIEANSLNEVEAHIAPTEVTVGSVSVGVVESLNTVDTSVYTNITESTLYAAEDIDVEATENLKLTNSINSVPVGAISVAVNTIHNYVSSAVVQDEYVEWNNDVVSAGTLMNSDASSLDIDDYVGAGTEYGQMVLDDVDKFYADKYYKTTVSQDIDMRKEARDITIDSEGQKVNLTKADLHAGRDINVEVNENVNTWGTTEHDGEASETVAVGAVEVAVSTQRVRVDANVGLNVSGGTFVADRNINLYSSTGGTLEAKTFQVGVGAVAVGVAIGEVTKSGSLGVALNTAKMQAGETISVLSEDKMQIINDGEADQGGLVDATAVDYKAKDSVITQIEVDSTYGANVLEAKNVEVLAHSLPSVNSKFWGTSVAAVLGCGVVMEATANNSASLEVDSGNKFLADTVVLESGVYAADGSYTVNNDITSIGVGVGIGISVNEAKSYTDVRATTTVGSLILKEEYDAEGNYVSDYGTTLTINAFDSTNIRGNIGSGVTAGVIASGTNQITTKVRSTVITEVDSGTAGITADKLSIGANSKDVVYGYANGDGGGVVDVSPEAAYIGLEIYGSTTTNLSGTFDVLSGMNVGALRTDDVQVLADAMQAELAGGSGTETNIKHINEATTLNVKDATIKSYGELNLLADNYIYINKDNGYAVKGNGIGGVDVSVATLNSDMNLNAAVNIDNVQIYGWDDINIGANTDGYLVLSNTVYSTSSWSSDPVADTDVVTKVTNKVNIKDSKGANDTEIRTEAAGKDLTISASDNLELYLRTYSEAGAGLLGVVLPLLNNTLDRVNSISLDEATLYSTQDVKLYSGKNLDGSLGNLYLKLSAECYNGNVSGVIPTIVEIKNSSTEKNTIAIGSEGVVRSIRHTELYGDKGHESVDKTAKYYSCLGYNVDYDSDYVTTSGGSVDSFISNDNYVEVNGTVTAGLANNLTIDIGTTAGEYVIVGDQERDAVVEANKTKATNEQKTIYKADGTIVYTPDANNTENTFIHFYNTNKDAYATEAEYEAAKQDSEDAARIIGLTAADFKVGSASYTETLGEQLNEVNALIAEYKNDTDQEAYNSLLAEQQRLQSLLEEACSATSEYPDMVDYIVVPDLVASGGNVTVNTKNFRGNGTVEAKGNPALTVNNYTNLMLVTQKITVDDPGGVITYNSTALDPNKSTSMQEQVRDINASSDSVNLALTAAQGTTAMVSVIGHYDGASIDYASCTYKYQDDNGEYIKFEPTEVKCNDVALATELNTDDHSYDYYGTYHYESQAAQKVYYTKESSNEQLIKYDGKNRLKDANGNNVSYDANGYYYIETSDGTYYLYTQAGDHKYRVRTTQLTSTDENGNVVYVSYGSDMIYYDDVKKGSFKPRANVQISGNINSLKGEVHIESKHNNITIGGDVTEDVSINAQKITIKADNGSIDQGYTDGTVNIGGDVQSQYKDEFNNFVNIYANKTSTATKTDVKLKTSEPSEYGEGSWIAGGQITISANDININGSIQSGYDTYTTKVTEADQATIDAIITSWTNAGKQQLTDTIVKNSGNTYIVKEGLATWNKERQCYEYQLPIYYNPSTKQLVTGDINASGGKISLTGRIASTGSGRIICMDGAYDINIENQLALDLRLGELAVNEVTGKISITDPSYYVSRTDAGVTTNFTVTTEITNEGISYTYYDTVEKKQKTTTSPTHVSGSGTSYTYTPVSGLRYDWVTGYSNTSYTKYYKEDMAKWWGAADYKEQSSATLDSWISGGQAVTIGSSTGEDKDRITGAYLTTGGTQTADVYFKHTGEVTSSTTKQVGSVEEWSSGFLGCHKWRKWTFEKSEGKTYSDYASIKATSPISITLMGVEAENSKVTVDTESNLYFGKLIGNSALYNEGGSYVEKGTVSLTSRNGSIYQEGSNIYGAKVNLTAKNDLQNISIMAGDTVELTGVLNGTGKANITVSAQYGGGEGNVLLNNLGGANAALVDLTAAGDIIQNTTSNLVQAKRINLTSGGVVSGQNGAALRLIGGQDADADSTDTLKASVNIDAQGDVIITQTEGDLRIGTIYAQGGDVVIGVPEGSIRDALPYEEQAEDTEAELIAKWQELGLIDDDNDPNTRSEAQIAKDELLAAGAEAYNQYVQATENQYAEMLRLGELKTERQARGTDLSESEQKIYDQYSAKFNGYSSAANYLETAPGVKDKVAKLKECETELTAHSTYQGWNKDKLLYALQDAVINQHAGVESSSKVPNIYAENVNLTVKNDVGLNNPEVTTFALESMTLDQLAKLSKADPATVTWTEEGEQKIITIQEKLAIGLQQQGGDGKITVTTTDTNANNTKNVFLEVRKDEVSGKVTNNYLSLVMGAITTAQGNGDVRLSSLQDILASSSFVLSAKDVVLLAGEQGTNDGNIGTNANYFHLNMTGELTATATGNIYLTQTAKDWNILSVAAGVAGEAASTTSGNIYLQSEGNIYGVYNSVTDAQGYIQTDSSGIISITSGGKIGDWDDLSKILRVKNSAADVWLSATGDITLEGVSTVDNDNPAGTLYITKAESGTGNMKLMVNGAVDLEDTDQDYENLYLDSALDVKVQATGIADLVITNTHANHEYTAEVNVPSVDIDKTDEGSKVTVTPTGGDKVSKQLENVTKGNIAVRVNSNDPDNSKDLVVNGDLRATGNIILINETGATKSLGDENVIFTEGFLGLYGTTITQEKNVVARSGIAYIAEGDVTAFSHYTATRGLYVESLNGNVDSAGLGSVGLIKGDLYLIAGNGTITNLCSYLTEGDITLMAKTSIDNNSNLILSEEQKQELTQRQIDITESVGMRSLNGNITISTQGTLTNTTGMVADTGDIVLYGKEAVQNDSYMRAKAGKVDITSDGGVTNSDGSEKKIVGYNGVTVTAGTTVDNGADLYANTGDVVVTAGTAISNSGNMFVVQEGNVNASAGTTLDNTGAIYTKSGNVTLTSGSAMTNSNSGNIYAVAGDVSLTSGDTLSNTAGAIFSRKGNVTLVAANDLTNESSIYALNGTVLLQSLKGNVSNDNPLTDKEGTYSDNISILAENGSVENTSILAAKNDITIKAKENLNIGSASEDYGLNAVNGILTLNVSDGTLTNYSILKAGQAVLMNAYGNIDSSNAITSLNDAVTMTSTAGYLQNAGAVSAVTGLTMTAKNQLKNTVDGALSVSKGSVSMLSGDADIDNDGSITVKGDVEMSAATKIANDGVITASEGNVSVVAGSQVQNTKDITATLGSIDIQGADVNNNGIFKAGTTVDVLADNSVTNTKSITAGSEVTLTAKGGTLYNTGAVSGTEITVTSGDDLSNSGLFKATAGDIAVTSGGTMVNSGAFSASENITVQVGESLTNASTGTLTAQKGMIKVTSVKKLQNKGTVEATKGNAILLSSAAYIDNQADITAGQSVVLTAGTALSNSGDIKAGLGGAVFMTAKNGDLTSSGTVEACRSVLMTARAGALTNSGNITSTGADYVSGEAGSDIGDTTSTGYNVIMVAKKDLQNNGSIVAPNNINLTTAANLINDGTLTATNGNVKILAAGNLTNNTGKDIVAGNNVQLMTKGGTLDNGGNVTAGNNAELLAVAGRIGNTGGVITATEGYVTLTAGSGDISNVANLVAGKYITLTAATSLTENGSMEAEEAITLTSQDGDMKNTGAATAGTTFTMTANGRMTNTGAVTAGDDVLLDALYLIYNEGALTSTTASVELKTEGHLENTAVINAQENVTLTALNIENGGNLTGTEGNVVATATDTLYNEGNISAGALGILTAGSTVINYGDVQTGTGAVLESATDAVYIGSAQKQVTITATAGGITITAGAKAVDCYGALQADGTGAINITAATDVNTNGSMIAGGDVNLTAGGELNNTGTIKSDGAITINAEETLTNSGRILSAKGGNVTITSKGNMTNNDGNIAVLEGGSVVMETGAALSNSGGILAVGGGDVSFTSENNLTNSGGIYTFDKTNHSGVVTLISNNANVDVTAGSFALSEDEVKKIQDIAKQYGVTIDIEKAQQVGDLLVADGSLNLLAENGSVVNNKGIAAYGDIIIKSKTSITNNSVEETAEGFATRSLYGDIELSSLGSGTNEGNITNTKGLKADNGSVILYAEGTLDNKGTVYAGKGNAFLRAKGNISNTGSVVAQRASDTTVEKPAYIGEIEDWSQWVEENGTNGGWISLISTNGNISNTSDSIDSADASIMMVAKEGSVTTSHKLSAAYHVVVASKGSLADILDNGVESRTSGNIYLYAYGTNADGVDNTADDGVIYNTSSITTADGSVYLVAHGSRTVALDVNSTQENCPVSIYNEATGDIIAQGGNVVLNGERAVVNQGDISATKNTAGEKGSITVVSNSGGVFLYDEPVTVDQQHADGKNIFSAAGEISIRAPYGVLYNEKDLVADGDVTMVYGGGGTDKSITVNNNITSNTGDVTLKTIERETKLIIASEITATKGEVQVVSAGALAIGASGDNKQLIAAEDDVFLNANDGAVIYGYVDSSKGDIAISTNKANADLLISSKITAEQGKVDIVSGGDMVIADTQDVDSEVKAYESAIINAGQTLTIAGNVTSVNNDVNVAAVGDVKVEGNLKASLYYCLVAVGTMEGGAVEITGDLSGKEVVIYTENPETTLSFGSIYVIDELTLAGNNWADMNMAEKVTTDSDGYDLRLFGAGRSNVDGNSGGVYDLNYGTSTDKINISVAMVDTLRIVTEGPVKIDNLSVANRAEIYAMGTKTDVYGRMQAYDNGAQVIYYSNGNGNGGGIDLHDMFFDGTPESYQTVMDQYKEDSITGFVTYGDGTQAGSGTNGIGMSLDIRTAHLQWGNGILLKDFRYQDVRNNRFSVEEVMQYRGSQKNHDFFNTYFDTGIVNFNSANLYELQGMDFNRGAKAATIKELPNGDIVIRDASEEEKKDLGFEF